MNKEIRLLQTVQNACNYSMNRLPVEILPISHN